MHSDKGFTLLEMAIVLSIIALLSASIIVGQTLIRGAQLRAVVSESMQYTQAVKLFREKYKAFPGDFINATNTWSTVTDNGDGNGWIDDQSANNYAEGFYAWTHLVAAGMVEGNYTGAAGPASAFDRIPGTNIASSKLSGAGWTLTSYTITDDANGLGYIYRYEANDMPPNHILWIGGRSLAASQLHMTPLLTDEEAYDIDKKIDDGIPDTGKVVAQDNPSNPDCGSEDDYLATPANAKLLTCSLVFKTGL